MSEIKFDTVELAKPVVVKQEIPVFRILGEDAESLRKVLQEFDFEKPPVNPNQFASSLVETCKQNKGVGLSANQCGFEHRVFVMGDGDNYVAHFNPTILAATHEDIHMEEGCLSFPFLGLRITRPQGIMVKYQDFNGEWHEATYEGLSARIFMHELDHLEGILYTQRAKPLALQSGLKKRNKMIKNLTRNIIMKSDTNGNTKRRNRKTVAGVV